MSRAILVPRCRATISGKKQLCPPQAVSLTRSPQPKSPGRITVCPRLLIGNNSVTPCNRARTNVCQMLIFIKFLSISVMIRASISAYPAKTVPALAQRRNDHLFSPGRSTGLSVAEPQLPSYWQALDYKWEWAAGPYSHRYSRGYPQRYFPPLGSTAAITSGARSTYLAHIARSGPPAKALQFPHSVDRGDSNRRWQFLHDLHQTTSLVRQSMLRSASDRGSSGAAGPVYRDDFVLSHQLSSSTSSQSHLGRCYQRPPHSWRGKAALPSLAGPGARSSKWDTCLRRDTY